MYELSTALAAEFMAGHPGISVYVEGGGTSTGFKGLEEGNIDSGCLAVFRMCLKGFQVSQYFLNLLTSPGRGQIAYHICAAHYIDRKTFLQATDWTSNRTGIVSHLLDV